MRKILVSACLLGDPVRYDGGAVLSPHPVLARWMAEWRIVACCPEIEGGLGVPRSPVELKGGDGSAVLEGLARAMGHVGDEVTQAFVTGAFATLALCHRLSIPMAVLKERSPSCGSSVLYDGTFSGRLRPGQGVTTALLRQHGIQVFSEDQWEDAQAFLGGLDRH
jgi:uncharacterized protein YbbK (DUF523 family)